MNEKIILGVTGSIACYKAPFVLRELVRRGFRVPVVMTRSATRFVGRVTFDALTDEGVYDSLWSRRETLSHVALLDGTSAILVAPATANIIAKAAAGIADDLLSSLLLAADPGSIIYAPAMNKGMWNNPATRGNVGKLRKRGSGFVEPASGELASGAIGKGRLAEIDEIALAAERAVRMDRILADKKIVITCGRTEEEIDPVRVITNRSSGLMGISLARAFSRLGADVRLIAGRVNVTLPSGVKVQSAFSASAMLDELGKQMPEADALIMAAAIADYSPLDYSEEKIKEDELTLKLKKTPDILTSLNSRRPVRIGFSVEAGEDWTRTAERKLADKSLDVIVANPARVIAAEETQAAIIFASGRRIISRAMTKDMLSRKLVEITRNLIQERNG
ncbi:bifunctional phosphopantothenoylcysteine decarboxylase/phosphopantothenate--cysteine ligase CoaBC [candidate division WOR-3 bacterium]|uniref:Coenzyme A biosynthesis bifunctional protein CoaBC n=1 Tax=candidate division WOR-3 bacterium TaxID=2052148 RepID=A0A9D5K9M3_UNCW3|nr:bifunctional phosphopantothenoylcysteine decarboxylase/phosphopantothenate--cysteine ligase CoaBC [candidate division WOR-3 bacterium]MBD3364936.1 bifunctional phosphopantothenoylcysteine decarboxylase/phosphopantothenate--cysteine ligase CoaBC [candidate division WOR-3 bacterium]